MALSDLRLPSQYTMQDLLAMANPGAFQDESGRWFSPTDEGRQRINTEDFDLYQAQQRAFLDAATQAGYVPELTNGLNQSVLDRSQEAQRRGIRTLDDYYRYQYGNGQWETDPRTGQRFYKGETTAQQNPFDFGTAEPDHWTSKLALGAILAGFGAAAGAAAGGAAGGEGAGAGWVSAEGGAGYAGGMAADAGALSGAAGSGGNVGFFDDILGNSVGNSGLTDVQQWADSLGGLNADGSINWAAIDASPALQSMGAISGDYGAIPFGTSASGTGTILDQINTLMNGGSLPGGLSSLKSLLSGELNSGGSSNFLSGLLGSGKDLLGSTLAVAPSLAAINYAKNQGPFDTSKLDSIYNGLQGNQSPYLKSLTDPYDETTAQGYGRLTQSLQDRGVSGSSFGNMDLTNYNTVRDRGRADILGTGMNNQLTLQSGVASKLLDAQAKERELKNNLYGSALYALAGGLRPQQTNVLGR